MTETEIYKRRWIILLMTVMVTFANCLDTSSLNVALPVVAQSLGVGMAQVEWVITINLLTIIGIILTYGRLGDIKGKDRIFKFGVVGFMIGSLVSFAAHSYGFLILGRVLAGLGGAATMATGQGITAETFPSHERGRALGLSGSSVALGTMLGPALGGFVVEHLDWHFIFLLNVPICLLNLCLAMKFMPRLSSESGARLDIKGSVVFAVFIGFLYMSIKLLQGGAEYYLMAGLLFAVAAALGMLFWRIEHRVAAPMLELGLFRNSIYTISVFCSFLSFFALSCNNFIQPFYLQKVLAISPAATGGIMMVYPVIMAVVAPCSGYLSDKMGSEGLGFIGLSLGTAGMIVLSFLTEHSTVAYFLSGIVLMALGFSLFQSPNTNLIMSSVPKNKLGAAGSTNSLTRNLGTVFGISLSTVFLYNSMSHQLGYVVTDYVPGRADVFVNSMQHVYQFAVCICLLGVTLSGWRLWHRKRVKPDTKVK